MAETTRVLLADDHPTVRLGIRAIVAGASDLTLVGEAANGQDHAGHPGGEGGADPRTPTVPPRLGTSRSRPPL